MHFLLVITVRQIVEMFYLEEEFFHQQQSPSMMQIPYFAWMTDITTMQHKRQGL